LQQVIAAIDPDQASPTQFEVITAAAWLYFAQQNVEIAVVEVGLGGRLDATNVCNRPLVSLITSLSREHWQRLGPTLADISREKAGILKPGCPAVIAPQPIEAETVIRQRLADLGCPAVWVTPAEDLGDGWAKDAVSSLRYPLPLSGNHQLINSAVAIAAIRQLQDQDWQISDEQIVHGMKQTHWPGRLQWFPWQNQMLLIDGAHNPAGAAMLRQYVDQNDRVTRPIHWVMGMLANKDHADIFQALFRPGDRLYLVPVPEHLTVDQAVLANLAWQACPDLQSCETYPDEFAALSIALEQATVSEPPSTVVLCGSLYLIGHFFQTALQ
jgi:dihydrofolate synthase/folylpolyglutamate synthase